MRLSKKFIGIAFFILPLFGIAQDEEFIEWSASKRLTWDDYLAQPLSSTDAAAITNTALGIEYHIRNNVLSYKMSCRFSKTRSWGLECIFTKTRRPTSTGTTGRHHVVEGRKYRL